MSKRAISVTLSEENVLWVKSMTTRKKLRSVSEALDRLVDDARMAQPRPARSIAGTARICGDDPELLEADRAVRALFAQSVRRGGRGL